MRKRWSNLLVDEWLISHKLPITRLSLFENVSTPLQYKCEVCDNIWSTAWVNIYSRGTRCPKCAIVRVAHLHTNSLDWWNAKLALVHILNMEPIIPGDNSAITWKCENCEYTWIATKSSIISPNFGGCKCCTGKLVNNQIIDTKLSDRNITRLDDFIATNTPISWSCNVCDHKWKTSPTKILNEGTGCPKCSNRVRHTNEDIDHRCGAIGIRRVGNYVNTHTKIEWCCKKCNNTWHAKPSNILNQHTGCPHCRTPSYSKKAIRWLNQTMQTDCCFIQHAENIGEYLVPDILVKVDGYCKETNTIYEFHGDIFHGNPNKFTADEMCSPFHKLTAGELYNKTKHKESKIMKAGYKLVVMWESEYDSKK
jgi:hypothetical protein